jgi:hypothetical protein
LSHIEDVQPPDCGGLADEGWWIGRLPHGHWVCWAVDQDPLVVATEAQARDYWNQAAEAHRQTQES